MYKSKVFLNLFYFTSLMNIYVIGHKNPDLDSVASAIALAYFKKQIGEKNWIPAVAGKIDTETTFVLKKFGFKVPELINNVKGKTIALVDHCCTTQMAEGYEDAEIIEVVDHHNISDIETKKPIRFHTEPVGSTCTIIASYFKTYNITILKKLAGLILCGIISDTDLFKSPTTTKLDIELGKELAKVSGINIEKIGIEMFKVKSNYENKSVNQIITEDLKEYDLPLSIKLAASQFKLMNIKKFLEKKDEIINEMKNIVKKRNYDLFVVIITDLLKEGSEVFAYGKTDIFEKSMNIKLTNNSVYIQGLMSRKKQVIPKLIG